MFEFHANHYWMQMPIGADGWTQTLNMQPMLSHLVLDIATEFLCGESTYSQILDLPNTRENAAIKAKYQLGTLDWTRFADCFDGATKTLGMRLRMFERCKVSQVFLQPDCGVADHKSNRLALLSSKLPPRMQRGPSLHGLLRQQGSRSHRARRREAIREGIQIRFPPRARQRDARPVVLAQSSTERIACRP